MNGSTTPEEEEKPAPPTQVKEKTSSTEKEEGGESRTTQREGREGSTTHEVKQHHPAFGRLVGLRRMFGLTHHFVVVTKPFFRVRQCVSLCVCLQGKVLV